LDSQLQTYELAVSKLVNSLSWNGRIRKPVAVDEARTIFQIDLAWYNWQARDWENLVQDYPYRQGEKDEGLIAIRKNTGDAKVPIVRADWFVEQVSKPPHYHEFLDIPTTALLLENILRVDVKDNINQGQAQRAGFAKSGVSANNRIIERHDRRPGYYWKSYDFDKNNLVNVNRNIFDAPLGPNVVRGFDHDGGELIFSLPNGLQGYMLVDKTGKRIDEAPTKIVQDPERPGSAVVNGISCMTCHAQGIIKKDDEIRDVVVANKDRYAERFGNDGLRNLLNLYPEVKSYREHLDADRDQFTKALEQTGNLVSETDSIFSLVQQFEKDLRIREASSELFLTEEEFRRRVQADRVLKAKLARLLIGSTIDRATFAKEFEEIAEKLQKSVPVKKPSQISYLDETRFDPLKERVFGFDAVAFSVAGTTSVVATGAHVFLYRHTAARVEKFKTLVLPDPRTGETISAVAISNKGDEVIAGTRVPTGTGSLYHWQEANKKQGLVSVKQDAGNVRAIAFDSKNKVWLAVVPGKVMRLSSGNKFESVVLPTRFQPSAVAVDGDGNLAVGSESLGMGLQSSIHLQRQSGSRNLGAGLADVVDLCFDQSGRSVTTVLTQSGRETFDLVRMPINLSGTRILFSSLSPISALAQTPDGEFVFVAVNNKVVMVDASQEKPQPVDVGVAVDGLVLDLAVSSDGGWLTTVTVKSLGTERFLARYSKGGMGFDQFWRGGGKTARIQLWRRQ
jgi:hypothetical protein